MSDFNARLKSLDQAYQNSEITKTEYLVGLEMIQTDIEQEAAQIKARIMDYFKPRD